MFLHFIFSQSYCVRSQQVLDFLVGKLFYTALHTVTENSMPDETSRGAWSDDLIWMYCYGEDKRMLHGHFYVIHRQDPSLRSTACSQTSALLSWKVWHGNLCNVYHNWNSIDQLHRIPHLTPQFEFIVTSKFPASAKSQLLFF